MGMGSEMTAIAIEMETVISTSMTTAPCWRTVTRGTETVTAGVMIATTARVAATEIRYIYPHSICYSILSRSLFPVKM